MIASNKTSLKERRNKLNLDLSLSIKSISCIVRERVNSSQDVTIDSLSSFHSENSHAPSIRNSIDEYEEDHQQANGF